MGKIQIIQKDLNEIKDYIGNNMCNLTNIMEQLAIELSNLECIEKDYKKKLSKKYQRKLINMTTEENIKDVLIDTIDSDKDGAPDIEGVKNLISKGAKLLDYNQDGVRNKKDIKDALLDLLTIIAFALFLMWQIYDGDFFVILLSGNREALSEFFRILCFSGIIPLIKFKFQTKFTTALGITKNLASELEKEKIIIQNLKQQIIESEAKHNIDLLKKDQEIELSKLTATTQSTALKTSILELTTKPEE